MAISTSQAYEFGQFRLDPAERTLLRQGEAVALTPKVFDTLVYLVENSGRLITKDEFMKQVWADAFVEEATLAQSISQLRKALGDPNVIETVPKKGYRFLQPVRTIEVSAESISLNSISGEKEIKQKSGSASRSKRRGRIFAFVAVLTAVVSFYFYQSSFHARPSFRSLAVLPLQNLSGDPNQEYFADGMTDELITDLAQIHSLRVISHTSVIQFKHTQKTLPEIAEQLNVDAVVEGSVLRTGNNVRITAQLLDARRDQHLWATSYEREIANVLDLQRQMAKTIADQVNAKLTPAEGAALAEQHATNPAAYDALLTGRFLFNRRNPADTEKAINYFQKAVALDPNNAQAWAALAYANASLGSDLGIASRAKVLPQAQAAIAKALVIDPNLAEAHTILAWIKLWYDWDWTGAEREFRRSLELNPNDSVAHREYSHYLQVRKRFDEALEENKRAIDLAPLDILPSIHLAWLYVDAREGAKAVEQSQHVLEMDPSFSGAYLMMANGYVLEGEWDEALAALKRVNNYPQDVEAGVAYIRAASGDKTQAQAALLKLTEFSRQNYVSPVTFASCYAAMGERDKAFDWLEKAYKERAPGLISLEVNSGLDNLRADPRFHDLERRVGF
ncbi:MAG TPA: winged helix-turn-helix domain-containing protein [Terriglobales bacterium]|nr:winged helix-turn-helix domain-containing protein [Terriglobales bacterium]